MARFRILVISSKNLNKAKKLTTTLLTEGTEAYSILPEKKMSLQWLDLFKRKQGIVLKNYKNKIKTN